MMNRMRRSIKLLVSLAFVFTAFSLLSSCATQKIYQRLDLPKEEISIVTTDIINYYVFLCVILTLWKLAELLHRV